MHGRLSLLISAAIVLLALAAGIGLDRYGRSARFFGAAGAPTDPRVEKIVTATPQEAYLHWKKRGFRGRRIVCVSDSWKRVDTTRYYQPPLGRQYPLQLYNLAEKQEAEFLSADNILYFADLGGIARQIVALLGTAGFSQLAGEAHQAKNVLFRDGEISMTHHGFPRTFTTVENFRADREPVLLLVNADYFRTGDPEILARRLAQSGLVTDSIVLCAQVTDPSVPATARAGLERFAVLLGMGGGARP